MRQKHMRAAFYIVFFVFQMLPAESLADVVSFLAYYDLGGVKLTSKRFSAVANQCADAIRLFDFSDLAFDVLYSWIDVYRDDESGTRHVRLKLNSAKYLAEFISEAFRDCTVGRL